MRLVTTVLWSLAAFCAEPKSDREIEAWLKTMQAPARRYNNVEPAEGAWLRDLVRKLKARRVLEIGTSTGYSGMWLAMGVSLIDRSRPVKVVWNGEARTLKTGQGRFALRAPGYEPAPLEKTSRVAGPIGDVFNTPFAIVMGTAAADPAMKEICRAKTDALVTFWKKWQRQTPRLFKDSELSDTDAARYSLILIGGADANLVTRRFQVKLPIEIASDRVTIAVRSFAASDAQVQLIFPHPLNAERYVLLIAGTSPEGLYFWVPDRLQGAEFDFTIEDGHMPGGQQRVSAADLWVAGGWFDQRWQMRDDLVYAGDPAMRSKAVVLHAPKPGRRIDAQMLEACAGEYEIRPGMLVKIKRRDDRLVAQAGEQPELELFPVSDFEFFIVEGPVKLVFEKDASGRVVSFKGWQNGQEFSAKEGTISCFFSGAGGHARCRIARSGKGRAGDSAAALASRPTFPGAAMSTYGDILNMPSTWR